MPCLPICVSSYHFGPSWSEVAVQLPDKLSGSEISDNSSGIKSVSTDVYKRQRSVNQQHGASSLNYYEYKKTGMRVIAVGGNSLSRGLTLEGLCVSYFYRNTMMYDTCLLYTSRCV